MGGGGEGAHGYYTVYTTVNSTVPRQLFVLHATNYSFIALNYILGGGGGGGGRGVCTGISGLNTRA